jgi:hypothetical protein
MPCLTNVTNHELKIVDDKKNGGLLLPRW